MSKTEVAIAVVFWRSSSGREPVRDWLRKCSKEERRVLGFDLRALQIGWPVGMLLSRSVGDGLWELRSKLPGGQIARIMFAFSDGQMVLLNAFVKKTQKTPPHEISLAKQRMKGVSE